jgi:hypothetical protein
LAGHLLGQAAQWQKIFTFACDSADSDNKGGAEQISRGAHLSLQLIGSLQ